MATKTLHKDMFDITGMTCAACEAHVHKAAQSVAGVQEANVNLLKNSMELVYDGKPKTAQKVVEAIDKAGYGAKMRQAKVNTKALAFVDPAIAAQKAVDAKRRQLIGSIIFGVPLLFLDGLQVARPRRTEYGLVDRSGLFGLLCLQYGRSLPDGIGTRCSRRRGCPSNHDEPPLL